MDSFATLYENSNVLVMDTEEIESTTKIIGNKDEIKKNNLNILRQIPYYRHLFELSFRMSADKGTMFYDSFVDRSLKSEVHASLARTEVIHLYVYKEPHSCLDLDLSKYKPNILIIPNGSTDVSGLFNEPDWVKESYKRLNFYIPKALKHALYGQYIPVERDYNPFEGNHPPLMECSPNSSIVPYQEDFRE